MSFPSGIKDTKMNRLKNKKHMQCKGPVVELKDMGRKDKDRDSLARDGGKSSLKYLSCILEDR